MLRTDFDTLLGMMCDLWPAWKITGAQREAFWNGAQGLDYRKAKLAAEEHYRTSSFNKPTLDSVINGARYAEAGDVPERLVADRERAYASRDGLRIAAANLRARWATDRPEHAAWYAGLTDERVVGLANAMIRDEADRRRLKSVRLVGDPMLLDPDSEGEVLLSHIESPKWRDKARKWAQKQTQNAYDGQRGGSFPTQIGDLV